MKEDRGHDPTPTEPDRRSFLSAASRLTMAGGLVASYGTLALIAGRFLYPARETPKAWMFLAEVGRLKPGDSFFYRTPSGVTVAALMPKPSSRSACAASSTHWLRVLRRSSRESS